MTAASASEAAMGQQQLLEQLGALSLGKDANQPGAPTGSGAALLRMLQGGGGAPAPPAGAAGGALPPPPGHQPGAFVEPEQAVSSLFGAGGSIWSSQTGGGGAQAPSTLGSGGLWGSLPGGAGWSAAAPPQQQQAPQQPSQAQLQQQWLAHQQQQHQQQAGTQPPAPHHPSPLQHAPQQQQHAQAPYQPLHLGPQQHLPPPQHPGLRSNGMYGAPPPSRLGQQQLGLLPQQHSAPYPHAPPGGQQLPPHLQPPAQHPRPVMQGYNPLSALLQPHSMAGQPHAGMPPSHPGVAPPAGMPPGGWGPGALFAGLPAMQQLAQQQQQAGQQQQQSGSQPPLAFPPMSPQARGGSLQQQAQAHAQAHAQAGFLQDMLRAAAGSASPPPPGEQRLSPPPAGAGARQQQRTPPPSRKPGTQQAAKPGAGRENRWVDVMDRQHDGRQPKANMRQLDAALAQLADSLMPTPEEKAAQMQAFEAVRSLLTARYPGARVHLFGSVANGLSVRHNNDIDVCLELADVAADDTAGKGEVAVVVGELMEAAGMSDVLTLPKARVPVVKFVVPRTGTKVDVTVNNLLACINTKLLADYCAIEPRLAPLVALVKHWAKQRAVNDPYRGTLSSYCYVLMCIFLLQTRPVPALPALQQLPPTFRRTVGLWTCEFCDEVESLRGFGAANTESLAELVWAFFEYWAWRHNYSHDVISIRRGACMHKDEKDWTRRIGNERHLVCIEDPFELTHDLGRTVDRQTRAVLHKEFTRAATLLRDAEDPLDALFAPYRPGQRG